MINAEKIVFEKQNYYTPSWSGVTPVKILEVLPNGKVRVKAGESIFVRSIQYMFNTAKAAQVYISMHLNQLHGHFDPPCRLK